MNYYVSRYLEVPYEYCRIQVNKFKQTQPPTSSLLHEIHKTRQEKNEIGNSLYSRYLHSTVPNICSTIPEHKGIVILEIYLLSFSTRPIFVGQWFFRNSNLHSYLKFIMVLKNIIQTLHGT